MFESCSFRVQGELDSALAGVRSHTDEAKSGVELQRQYEQLVCSLEELLSLGSERLALQADTELHSRARLQQQLSGHTVRRRTRHSNCFAV